MALRGERRFISINNVLSGMLIQFSYRKATDNSIKNYTIIVVDPNKNNYLHGLLIDDLSDSELIGLITQLGEFNYDPTNRSSPITNLQSDVSYNKYKGLNQRRYRTFLLNNISNLRQILIGKVE